MHSWSWFLIAVCGGLFLGAELAAWRADRRRNPGRPEIRRRSVRYRLDRVRVVRARIDGREQSKGFRGLSLVVRQGAVELAHVVPGHLLLVPDWYRVVDDVAMDMVGRSGAGALRLTFRSAQGDGFDEVLLDPSPEDRAAAWQALAAAGVSRGAGSIDPPERT